jgi:hypothetical protein
MINYLNHGNWAEMRAYPLSHSRGFLGIVQNEDKVTFTWFNHRFSNATGTKVVLDVHPLENGSDWNFSLRLEGYPLTMNREDYDFTPPEKTILERKGSLTKQYGWWCFDRKCMPPLPKFPVIPDKDTKRRDLAVAASEAIAYSNTQLLSALYDAGLDIKDHFTDDPGVQTPSELEQSVIYNSPRVVEFLLKRFPEFRQNRAVMWRTCNGAYAEGETEILQMLACKTSDEVIAGYPADLVSDFIVNAENGGRVSDDLFFISWNGSDPDPKIETLLTGIWPNALKFSEAEVGDFKEGDQSSNFRHKTSKKLGSKIELELIRESDTVYHYSIRETRGFLAGGGNKGKLVSAYGYWLKSESSSWDE